MGGEPATVPLSNAPGLVAAAQKLLLLLLWQELTPLMAALAANKLKCAELL
jgi:hypothetical protein